MLYKKNETSEYFKAKINTNDFQIRMSKLLDSLKNKKVLLYGAGLGFVELNRIYNFYEKLNIIGIADRKFKKSNEFWNGYRTVCVDDIKSEDFDIVLVTNEFFQPICTYLFYDCFVPQEKIETIFFEDIRDEQINYNYLSSFNFKNNLDKLQKQCIGKKVVIYGAGLFLEVIQKYFDLSGFDIIAISDKKFENSNDIKSVYGYPTCSPSKICELKPDIVIVATKNYVKIICDLYYNVLSHSKIKIKPLLKKPFGVLLKEIFNG